MTRPLTDRQANALRSLSYGFVSTRQVASMPSLARRGLVLDHGRYWESRGKDDRYELTDAGREELGLVDVPG